MAKLCIHSKHFKYNLDLIASHLGSKARIALVLKDNAYGHGLMEIARLAQTYGIKTVFVKNEFEALQIQDLFPHITALYGDISPQTPQNIYQSIHSLQTLHQVHPHRPIELKINTGMNRNGIQEQEIQAAMEIIHARKLHLKGVFSHNGYGDEGSEEMERQHARAQEAKKQICYLAEKLNLPLPRFHFLSSSSALRLLPTPKASGTQAPATQAAKASATESTELVRVGLAAYGYVCAPLGLDLKPIASLWAQKISSRSLRAGERVGYGGAGVIPADGVVSTYDLGYGDGLLRLDEHHAPLHCARGERILPRLSMDCFSCLSDAEEICVFEDAWEWARVFGTTPYEILVKLSPFLPKELL